MRHDGYKRIVLAGMLAIAGGTLVAYDNPVQSIDRKADNQVAQIARTAHDISSDFTGRRAEVIRRS